MKKERWPHFQIYTKAKPLNQHIVYHSEASTILSCHWFKQLWNTMFLTIRKLQRQECVCVHCQGIFVISRERPLSQKLGFSKLHSKVRFFFTPPMAIWTKHIVLLCVQNEPICLPPQQHPLCSESSPAEMRHSPFGKLASKNIIHAHAKPGQSLHKRESDHKRRPEKKFVTQLIWALYILLSICGSIYICLPLFLSVPLCLAFLCAVNCKLFPNATVNGIDGKQNLARIVLACTVCFTAREITLNVLIICTHHSQNVTQRKSQQF